MEKLTVQFATQTGLVSWAIRRLTWSNYSHVDLVLQSGALLGARSDTGVRVRPPHYAPFTSTMQCEVLVKDGARDRIFARALSQVGKPYDFYAIANFGLHRSHQWRDESRWFCSEFVAWCFAMEGEPLLNTCDCDRISPRDLALSPRLAPVGGGGVLKKCKADSLLCKPDEWVACHLCGRMMPQSFCETHRGLRHPELKS